MKWIYPAVAGAAAFVALAQSPRDSPAQTPTFTSTTKLVQVTVVAHDKRGKPITDLKKEDFELSENGQRQNLSVFLFGRGAAITPPAPRPNEFSNRLAVTDAARPGYTVILLDWLNSGMDVRLRAKQEVLKLLKQIEARDMVALCVLDRSLRVLHDFTSDREELVRKINATYVALMEGPPDSTVVTTADTLDLTPVDLIISGETRFLAARRVINTLQAFEQISEYLGSAPGRKSLVWLTSGFPTAMGYDAPPPTASPATRTSTRSVWEGPRTGTTAPGGDVAAWERMVRTERRVFTTEMERAFQRLNDADIAVYPVDGRGMLPASGGYINITSMNEIASRTGGRAYYNKNDIATAIRSAIDDGSSSYTLGYYPMNTRADGGFRNIRVKVRRSGVELRYRRGYAAEDDTKPRTNGEEDLKRVLGSPLDATLVPLRAEAKKSGAKLAVKVTADVAALMLREVNGSRQGGVSLFFAFRPEEITGRIELESLSHALNIPQTQYQRAVEQGLSFGKELVVPVKATSLRIAIRDDESGALGSITIPLSAVH